MTPHSASVLAKNEGFACAVLDCPNAPSSTSHQQHKRSRCHIKVPGHKLMSDDELVPHHNDILLGRGGKNNQHVGNEQLRELARSQRENYRISSKKGKSYISRQIVSFVRQLSPPGRFLKKNGLTGKWEDVGDEVAREKASQALRDAVSAQQFNPISDKAQQEYRRSSSAPPVVLSMSSTPLSPVNAMRPTKRFRSFSEQPQSESSVSNPETVGSQKKLSQQTLTSLQQQQKHSTPHCANFNVSASKIPPSATNQETMSTSSSVDLSESPIRDLGIDVADDFDLFDGALLDDDLEVTKAFDEDFGSPSEVHSNKTV